MTLSGSPSETSMPDSPQKQGSGTCGKLTTLVSNVNSSNRNCFSQEHDEEQQEQEQASAANVPSESSSYPLDSSQVPPESYPVEFQCQPQPQPRPIESTLSSINMMSNVASQPAAVSAAIPRPVASSTTSAQATTPVTTAILSTSIARHAAPTSALPHSRASSSKTHQSATASTSAPQRNSRVQPITSSSKRHINRTRRSPGKQLRPVKSPAPSPDPSTYPPLPPVKVRDFAGEPIPPLKDFPVDPAWVVDALPGRIRGVAPVDGVFQRHTETWEARHEYSLYRTGMNRADPPGTKPKLWGGLNKEEDEKKWKETYGEALPLTIQRTEEDLEKGMYIINEERRQREKGEAKAQDGNCESERVAGEAKWREATDRARRPPSPPVKPPSDSKSLFSTMLPRGGTFMEPTFAFPSRAQPKPSIHHSERAASSSASTLIPDPSHFPKRKRDDIDGGVEADMDKRRRKGENGEDDDAKGEGKDSQIVAAPAGSTSMQTAEDNNSTGTEPNTSPPPNRRITVTSVMDVLLATLPRGAKTPVLQDEMVLACADDTITTSRRGLGKKQMLNGARATSSKVFSVRHPRDLTNNVRVPRRVSTPTLAIAPCANPFPGDPALKPWQLEGKIPGCRQQQYGRSARTVKRISRTSERAP
ncbi:hypothetical protein BU17DRAFT_63254 [Hysterangium stoloniferum]|nr:hypothetical protein BU17DRAFT_63254 [Hysterangium stoloniferum]